MVFPKTGRVLAVGLGLLCGSNAWADTFCARVDILMASLANTGEQTSFEFADVRVDCTRSQGLGGTVVMHCAWPYEYRSPVAIADFERAVGLAAACGALIAPDPTSVSHPDCYDLRQFRVGQGILNVSLKDKARLVQTYLFVRFEQSSDR